MSEIKLGDQVKDIISGFEGIVTGACKYLTGCTQFSVIPRVDDKGNFSEGHWFDEDRLVVTEESVVSIPSNSNGGSTADAPRVK
jgi:hypothetical protein